MVESLVEDPESENISDIQKINIEQDWLTRLRGFRSTLVNIFI